MGYLNFEHQLLKLIQSEIPVGATFVLGVSGGRDSMALLHAFAQIKKSLSAYKIQVLHVHHGNSSDNKQLIFRDSAADFVKTVTEGLQLPLHIHTVKTELKTEAQFRQARNEAFLALSRQSPQAHFVLGHHAEDLLETRLIQLVRGIRRSSFEQIGVLRNFRFRPFLNTSRQEIESYLASRDVEFIDDPSNLEQGPLRNWMRLHWLPQLEAKKQGSLKSLARNLNEISKPSFEALLLRKKIQEWGKSHAIPTAEYMRLAISGRKEAIIYLAQSLNTNLTLGQVKEVQKQLDKPQKDHSFIVSKLIWAVNAKRVKVSKTGT